MRYAGTVETRRLTMVRFIRTEKYTPVTRSRDDTGALRYLNKNVQIDRKIRYAYLIRLRLDIFDASSATLRILLQLRLQCLNTILLYLAVNVC